MVFKSGQAQFPLELFWGWTVLKHQGMAADGKVLSDLDKKELNHRA